MTKEMTKRTRAAGESPQALGRDYPARRVLELIGDRWTPVVLHALSAEVAGRGGVVRYSGLQRAIPDVSKKMLTQVLRRLEADGLVDRAVYAVVPPRTEYRLTPLGRRLHEPVAALCRWAVAHGDVLDAVFERRGGEAAA